MTFGFNISIDNGLTASAIGDNEYGVVPGETKELQVDASCYAGGLA